MSLLFYDPLISSEHQQLLLQQMMENQMTSEPSRTFRSIEKDKNTLQNYKRIFGQINELLGTVMLGEQIASAITNQIDNYLNLAQRIFDALFEQSLNTGGARDLVTYTCAMITTIQKKYIIKQERPPSESVNFKNKLLQMGFQCDSSAPANFTNEEQITMNNEAEAFDRKNQMKLQKIQEQQRIQQLEAMNGINTGISVDSTADDDQYTNYMMQRMRNNLMNGLTQNQRVEYERMTEPANNSDGFIGALADGIQEIADAVFENNSNQRQRTADETVSYLIPEFRESREQRIQRDFLRRQGMRTGEVPLPPSQNTQLRSANEPLLEMSLDNHNRQLGEDIRRGFYGDDTLNRNMLYEATHGAEQRSNDSYVLSEYARRNEQERNRQSGIPSVLSSDGVGPTITTKTNRSIEELDRIILTGVENIVSLPIKQKTEAALLLQQEIPPQFRSVYGPLIEGILENISGELAEMEKVKNILANDNRLSDSQINKYESFLRENGEEFIPMSEKRALARLNGLEKMENLTGYESAPISLFTVEKEVEDLILEKPRDWIRTIARTFTESNREEVEKIKNIIQSYSSDIPQAAYTSLINLAKLRQSELSTQLSTPPKRPQVPSPKISPKIVPQPPIFTTTKQDIENEINRFRTTEINSINDAQILEARIKAFYEKNDRFLSSQQRGEFADMITAVSMYSNFQPKRKQKRDTRISQRAFSGVTIPEEEEEEDLSRIYFAPTTLEKEIKKSGKGFSRNARRKNNVKRKK